MSGEVPQRKKGGCYDVDVTRDANKVIITEPLGFDFDDGRLVLTIRQAKELEEALKARWIYQELEEGVDNEDG